MRARRLRRLGVSPVAQSPLNETQTIIEATQSKNDSTLDAQKNKISSSTHGSVEIDENEHKQKQIKFDEDVDVRQKKESILNNNDEPMCKEFVYLILLNLRLNFVSFEILVTNQSNLAGCSRLLSEHINQQENVLNQNVENVPSEADTNRMETDENCDETVAVVEKMETEDIHHLTRKRSENEFQPEAPTVDERTLCLSRILDAFWDDNCVGKIIVSETAYNRPKDDADAAINYEDLASQILVEIAMEYFDGKLVDVIDSSSKSDKWKASTSSDASCPVPMMQPFNPANEAVFKYFMVAYTRCEREVLKYNDAQSVKKLDSATVGNTLNMINNVKQQIVRYTILLLENKLRPMAKDSRKYSDKSPLVKLLLENEIPSDFLRCIVNEASKKPSSFNTIFDQVVNSLNIYMQTNATIDVKLCLTPVCALNELLNVTLIDEPNVRPICNLIAKKKNFYPALTTEFTGREITKTSFLGPFLSMSVFSEDNPRILDDENKKQEIEHISDNLRSVSLCL